MRSSPATLPETKTSRFFYLTGGHHHQIGASICDRILEAESVLQSVTQLGEECIEHRIRNRRQSSQCRDRRCMFLSNRCHSSNDFQRARLFFFFVLFSIWGSGAGCGLTDLAIMDICICLCDMCVLFFFFVFSPSPVTFAACRLIYFLII